MSWWSYWLIICRIGNWQTQQWVNLVETTVLVVNTSSRYKKREKRRRHITTSFFFSYMQLVCNTRVVCPRASSGGHVFSSWIITKIKRNEREEEGVFFFREPPTGTIRLRPPLKGSGCTPFVGLGEKSPTGESQGWKRRRQQQQFHRSAEPTAKRLRSFNFSVVCCEHFHGKTKSFAGNERLALFLHLLISSAGPLSCVVVFVLLCVQWLSGATSSYETLNTTSRSLKVRILLAVYSSEVGNTAVCRNSFL